MSKAILLVDGENFKHKVREVILSNKAGKVSVDFSKLSLQKLFTNALSKRKDLKETENRYYCAKIHVTPETKKQSEKLAASLRALKTSLELQDFIFKAAGNVRAQKIEVAGKSKMTFREKGVDVHLAVDMVVAACDKLADTIILCSSDSDLQPAVHEVKSRGIEVVYLGFEVNPNKGLIASCNKTILFKDSEILSALKLV